MRSCSHFDSAVRSFARSMTPSLTELARFDCPVTLAKKLVPAVNDTIGCRCESRATSVILLFLSSGDEKSASQILITLVASRSSCAPALRRSATTRAFLDVAVLRRQLLTIRTRDPKEPVSKVNCTIFANMFLPRVAKRYTRISKLVSRHSPTRSSC